MIGSMKVHLAPLSCLLALSSLAPAAQAPEAQPPAQPAAAAPAPGQIPASASAAARGQWEALVKATQGESTGAIRAFQLKFDARVYSGDKQSNDGVTLYKYLEPDFVSMVLPSGRERMRGKKGDFIVDKSGVYDLEGREYKEDKRELAETLRVAKLFASLTDPSRLRLASLDTLSAPPAGLPADQSERAAGLDWIALSSPDFLARSPGEKETLDRVEIGLDRSTHLPVLAIVANPAQPTSAVLALLDKYQPLDGYRVPSEVTTWRVAPPPTGASPEPSNARLPFSSRAAVKLWLKEGTLRAQLQPKDFEPPS